VEKVLVLGDIVGYYYQPDLILKMLSIWNCTIIKGNHEVILKKLVDNKIDATLIKNKYGSGHEKALNNLSQKELAYLFNLPIQENLTIENVTFQLNHGAPWDQDEYLYPDAPTETLLKCNSKEYDFVLIGHSHYAFSFDCGNSILINSGSVGQSRQKGGVANWTLIDTDDKSYKLMKTPYDVSELLLEIEQVDPNNKYLADILVR
jgi:predicted phosphodiesterase